MMSILTGIIPLRTSMSGLISVKESGTLYTPSTGDTLTTVNFTDDNFSDYCSSAYTKEMAIPRRYALSRYSNVSKFPYGILYSFDKSTYCVKDSEIPNYTNFVVPQGVFVVKLYSNGKMLVNTSGTTESAPWEVVFDNPFIIPSEVRVGVNDYTVEATGPYTISTGTIEEFYITHNNGKKELYMYISIPGSAVPALYLVTGGIFNINNITLNYTFSRSNFFDTIPYMQVETGYCDKGFWPSGIITPSKEGTGSFSLEGPPTSKPSSIKLCVHLTQPK